MSAVVVGDTQLRALLEAADRASTAGRREEEARFLSDAQAAAPGHPMVMNALAMSAFSRGDMQQARSLLESALIVDTRAPTLWLNFALVCRGLNDTSNEMAALDKALALNPYYFLALLQKATTLERLGKAKQAASVFQAFIACVPPQAQQSPSVQAAVVYAREAVQSNNQALDSYLKERLGFLSQSGQERFEECIDVLLGKKRVFTQQPTFMHFPRLPAIPFYDRGDFSWLNTVEAAADEIRKELIGVLKDNHDDFVPYVAHPEGAPLNQWQELNNSRRWGAFHLWREGQRVEENLARCPTTASILAKAPSPKMLGHAPNAFFSLLEPRTRIPPHTGVTNTRLVVHVPLVIPPSCGFRVGSVTREWQRGKAWVFDDTIEHEAWNNSDEPRAILIFDIWNPYLTEVERELVRTATESIGDFYQGETPYTAGL